MTDQRRPPQHDRLDDAIDRTVQAITRADAPTTIRWRVLARIAECQPAESAAPTAWLQPRRLAWAVTAVAVILGSTLVAPRWWDRFNAPPAGTTAEWTPANQTPPSAVTDTARLLAGQPARSTRADMTPRRSQSRTRDASARAALAAPAMRPPLIDPLSPPDPIAITALETEPVTTEGLNIAPMHVEPLRIEPIDAQR